MDYKMRRYLCEDCDILRRRRTQPYVSLLCPECGGEMTVEGYD